MIGVAVIVVVSTGGSSGTGSSTSAADIVTSATSVKPAVFDDVGVGSSNNAPKSIHGAAALEKDGKPRIVYIGAEYCPYCATERWAMVMALSRFGTFSNLGVTHSSGADQYPNTPTFTFHGASYSSPYLDFDGVEIASNEVQGSSWAPLDTPTAEEQSLLKKYDGPPYIAADDAGAIPFIDVGNRYMVSGAGYDPGVLQGHTATSIAASLSEPGSAISKGAVGTANMLSAAICKITNGQPAKVCTSSGVTTAARSLD